MKKTAQGDFSEITMRCLWLQAEMTLSDADWWLDFTRDRLDGAILREKLSFNLSLLYDNTTSR
jgi:hypothetical protein